MINQRFKQLISTFFVVLFLFSGSTSAKSAVSFFDVSRECYRLFSYFNIIRVSNGYEQMGLKKDEKYFKDSRIFSAKMVETSLIYSSKAIKVRKNKQLSNDIKGSTTLDHAFFDELAALVKGLESPAQRRQYLIGEFEKCEPVASQYENMLQKLTIKKSG